MIFCKTTIGFGSPNKSGTSDAHGSPLGDEEITKTRDALGWNHEPFEVPESVYEYWNAESDGAELNNSWNQLMDSYKDSNSEKHAELTRRILGDMPQEFDKKYADFLDNCDNENTSMATRKASQVCLDFFVKEMPELVGGSADLTPSNNTFSKSSSTFSSDNPTGNHINYGVREFGMSAIMNGMLLHGGIKPYGATFLVFTDYARNAIRLSALMKIPNIFVYTHDSIALGEDGPTHQPVEHLVTLRSTPNLKNWRPADLVETAVAWKNAVKSIDSPTCLIFSRQNTSPITRNQNQINSIEKGGYLIKESTDSQITLVASGSELQLILDASENLEKDHGVISNVVSMPSLDVFLENNEEYQSSIIKSDLPILVVELSHPNSWYKLLNKNDKVLGIETFGESAPAGILLEHFGFTIPNVVDMAKSLVDE
jgi:transketolase